MYKTFTASYLSVYVSGPPGDILGTTYKTFTLQVIDMC